MFDVLKSDKRKCHGMTTRIYAHRGASYDAPENTMTAFRKALEQGAEGIELDLQMSKDGRLMVIHDETLDRTTDGTGLVVQYTYDELRRFNAKYKFADLSFEPIPVLEDVLELLAGTQVELNIELKNGIVPYERMEEETVRLVKAWGMERRVVVSSFNHYSLVKLSRIAPDIQTAILYSAGLVEPWHYARSIGAKGLHPHFYSVRPEIVAGAHAAGIAIRPYTVDDPVMMRTLIGYGCDAIITNKPSLMKQVRDGGL
jgi:glycerophosphoryl diester phosphodiesterase